ncbi:Mss4p nuclear export [Arthrobotrys megalospora]
MGREGDPFAFLSVVNLELHRNNEAVKSLLTYLQDRTLSTPLQELLSPLLNTTNEEDKSNNKLAIILSERLINMPPDISPPAYKMLVEEIGYAVEDNEPYTFTHYLLLSKVYKEIESSLPSTESTSSRPSKRSKKSKKSSKSSNTTFPFHPEDDTFLQNSTSSIIYKYKQEPPPEAADSKRAFQEVGIMPMGRMVLMTKDGFEAAVAGM